MKKAQWEVPDWVDADEQDHKLHECLMTEKVQALGEFIVPRERDTGVGVGANESNAAATFTIKHEAPEPARTYAGEDINTFDDFVTLVDESKEEIVELFERDADDFKNYVLEQKKAHGVSDLQMSTLDVRRIVKAFRSHY